LKAMSPLPPRWLQPIDVDDDNEEEEGEDAADDTCHNALETRVRRLIPACRRLPKAGLYKFANPD
jgi:hypothetical protein